MREVDVACSPCLSPCCVDPDELGVDENEDDVELTTVAHSQDLLQRRDIGRGQHR